MAESDLETTWYPLIGKYAAEELRRYRRSFWWVLTGVVCAVGAGALLGISLLGDVVGGVCAVGAVVGVCMFIRAQWRTAAAVSEWFGVARMRWLPRMTPQRFDEWRRLRGFQTPDERIAGAEGVRLAPTD